MRNVLLTILFLGCAFTSFAQDTTNQAPAPATSILIARTGVQTDAPFVGTYHLLELLQVRGEWIYPDIGAIDFGHGNYHEFFIGAGRTVYDGKKATVVNELYFDQATGPAAKSASYLQPWTLVDLRFTPKLISETVYFPYVPLNQAARVQHVLERAKVEYVASKKWKFGGGYAGYKYGDDAWQSKPFVTTTLTTNQGSFELWLQKMPGGGQVQLRYTLVHTPKR